MNAAIKMVGNRLVGYITHIMPHMIGCGEFIDEGGNPAFYNFYRFDGAITQLLSAGFAVSFPPPEYVEFLRRVPGATPPTFNWDCLLPATRDALEPYQKDAITHCIEVLDQRGILTMSAGTGKTLTSLALSCHGGPRKLYIVTSAKIPDWLAENKRWIGDTGLAAVATRDAPIESTSVVCSYDIATYNTHIHDVRWDCVVVDECHLLKGDSERARRIIPLILHRCESLYMLSATPQELGTSDLFNILNAVDKNTFACRKVFTQRYSNGHYNECGDWVERGSRNVEELSILLNKCMYRATSDVLDLPLLEREIVQVSWVPTQARNLTKLELERKGLQASRAIESEDIKRGRGSAAKLKRIHLAQYRTKNAILGELGKIKVEIAFPECNEILKRHKGEGVVFFVRHVDLAAKFGRTLVANGHECVVATGKVAPKPRLAMLNKLRDGVVRIGVLTIDACGTGFNLCPGVSVVVFLELPHTYAKIDQAECRARRIGATRPVHSYVLLLKDSTDGEQWKKLTTQQKINYRVLDGTTQKNAEPQANAPGHRDD